ncbi:MAG: hypothetical protein E7630_01370 [Ruminococcaceae bacterium]|nr:hypothetical protein [Oscillospiraceae bacterium]
MKMRKLFAILVASALLAALAIVPTSAAYVIDYTTTHTFASQADLGDLAPEGNVTVSDNAAVIAANGYMLKAFTANTYNAMELQMTVTAGSVSIRMGKTSSASFQVKFTATDYTIYTDNPAAGAFQRTVKTASYTDSIVFSYVIDKISNKAIFTVNGEETVLNAVVTDAEATPLVNAGPLDVSFTNWAGFGIFADGTANASVSSIKLGAAVSTIVQESDKDVTVTVDPTNQDATPATKDVTIAFGDFAFTYTVTNKVNPSNGEVLESEGTWSATTDTVQITNNTVAGYEGENVTVWATASYAPVANAVPGVSFDLDNTNANELGSGEDVTITGTLSGTPTNVKDAAVAVVLGTITVVVESVDPSV